jgi:hypothetical protein
MADLMEALRASVAAAKASAPTKRARSSPSEGARSGSSGGASPKRTTRARSKR